MKPAQFIDVSVTYDNTDGAHDDKPWVVHLPSGDIIRKHSAASARAYCFDMGWKPFMGSLRNSLPGDHSQ